MVISHDRYLIERIADNTYALFGDGKLTHLPGGIDEYLARRKAIDAANPAGVLDLGGASTRRSPEGHDAEQPDDDTSAVPAPSNGLSAQEEHKLTKQMKSIERKMDKLDAEVADLDAQMAAAAEKVDTEKLTELDEKKRDVASRREELEMEWLELGEQLEG